MFSISGRDGRLIDRLTMTFLENYEPSTDILENALIMLVRARRESSKSSHPSGFGARIRARADHFAVEVNAETEFFGKVDTSLRTEFTNEFEVELSRD